MQTIKIKDTRSKAKTPQEYYELVQQALFEVQDLKAALEYESLGMEAALKFVDDLEEGLEQMAADMRNGDYLFGREDLPFMEIINQQDAHVVPFKKLLDDINYIHIHGLSVDEEDED